MKTDWKALCTELVNSWTEGRDIVGPMHRARTALDQPEPEGPTVMEIIELADEIEAEELGQVDLVRRALARWGRPEPKGSTDEGLIQRLLSLAEQAVKEALDFEYEDPEDRYIWRELQELKQLVKETNGKA